MFLKLIFVDIAGETRGDIPPESLSDMSPIISDKSAFQDIRVQKHHGLGRPAHVALPFCLVKPHDSQLGKFIKRLLSLLRATSRAGIPRQRSNTDSSRKNKSPPFRGDHSAGGN